VFLAALKPKILLKDRLQNQNFIHCALPLQISVLTGHKLTSNEKAPVFTEAFSIYKLYFN
jgi:hypothetical protein